MPRRHQPAHPLSHKQRGIPNNSEHMVTASGRGEAAATRKLFSARKRVLQPDRAEPAKISGTANFMNLTE